MADIHKCVNGKKVVYSMDACVTGAVKYDARRASIGDSGAKPVSIPRGAGGLFRVTGSIDDQPIEFVVDTGASMTTLSGATAYKLGLPGCVPVGVVRTANGDVDSCQIVLPKLSVAEFAFTNVRVAISQKMTADALLGNDLLSKFVVTQQKDVMTLSK